MKNIVRCSFSIVLVLAFHFPLFAQSISGPTTVCANTQTRYTFNGGCPNVTWDAGPGVTVVSQAATTIDLIFPFFTADKTYRIFGTCGASATVYLDVTVKGSQSVSQNMDIPCNFQGIKTFRVDQTYANRTTNWENSAGWPVAGGPRPVQDAQGIWYSEIDYNINNLNSGTVTATVISNECPSVPSLILTTHVTRSTSNSLPAPTFSAHPTQQCLNVSNTFSVQPYANAISYTWNSDHPTMKINGKTPPVTINATSNGNAVTISESTNTYTANVTVTAQTSCGQTLAASTPLTIGQPNASISGPTDVWSGDISYYLVDPEISGATYSWQVGGGTIQAGQGSYKIRVQWPLGVGGSTVVAVTVSNAQATCGSVMRLLLPVVINDAGTFSISPNPASNIIRVTANDDNALKANTTVTKDVQYAQISELMIVDKFNNIKKVIKCPSNTRATTVDVHDLSPDMYILRIRSNDTWISKKFMVTAH
jgi:hypothetical protein